MPCLYMHFYIEHNFGHHLKVATPEDGASAQYNRPYTHFGFHPLLDNIKAFGRFKSKC